MRLIVVLLSFFTLEALLSILCPTARAAVFTCQQKISESLGGKTIWLTVEAGQAPFETTGSYRIDLKADGTYSVPAAAGIAARSGTWTASRPSDYLVVRIKNFHTDATEDVLVLFDNCPSCSSCQYSFHRENLPTGAQSGTFVITDGESPPAPPASVGLQGLTGGGTYQAGTSAFLTPEINYVGNPSTYKFEWLKDGVPVAAEFPGFLQVNNLSPANAGTYSVLVSRSGVTNSASTPIAVVPADVPPAYRGRAWTKLLDGEPSFMATRTPFKVRNGVVTFGFPSTGRGVWRWEAGKLEQLVTSTTAVVDGIAFAGVDHVTSESEGAFNFVVRNKLYEARGGQITLVATPNLLVQAVSRSGAQVVFVGSNSVGQQWGVYLLGNDALQTLVAPTLDLPGRLAKMEFVKSLSFDGERVMLLAFEGQNAGIFTVSTGTDPVVRLYAETGMAGPDNQTYRTFYGASLHGDLIFAAAELQPGGTSAVGLERTGKAARFGGSASRDLVNASISASRERQFHQVGPSALQHGVDGQLLRYLGQNDKLDGKTIDRFTGVDADGDDVVAQVEFTDGSTGIYGLLAGAVPPPPPPAALELGKPVLVNQKMEFSAPTVTGKSYALETKTSLSDPAWTNVETFSGTGSPKILTLATGGIAAFYRVTQLP